MKNKILIIVFMLLMTNGLVKAQTPWVFPGNTPAFADFVGTTNAMHLTLQTQQAQSIHFLTFGKPRMQIFDTTASNNYNSGFVGIGNFNTFTPQSLLHLHSDSGSINGEYVQWTSSLTEAYSSYLGMRAGLNFHGEAQIRQEGTPGYLGILQFPLEFWVNASTPNSPIAAERVHIFAGDTTVNNFNQFGADDMTRVGIWEYGKDSSYTDTLVPLALLQLGEPQYVNYAGHRRWMDVGTYTNMNTDNMYVGLRTMAYDKTLAVINFGDNPSNVAATGDRLVFNFTLDTNQYSGKNAGHYGGLEIERIWTDGNMGRIGIGGDTTATPKNWYNACGTKSADPNNTLEINSPDTTDQQTTGGNSGLRFTDLTINSHPVTNWSSPLLSVNSCGDVQLVKFRDTLSYGFAHCPGDSLPLPIANNNIFQMNLDSNIIYFAGAATTAANGSTINSVSVGYDCTTAAAGPTAKLEVFRPQVGPKNTAPTAFKAINSDVASTVAGSSYSIYSLNQGKNGTNYAGYFVDSGASTNTYGIWATGAGFTGKNFYGVAGIADGNVAGTSLLNTISNFGVYGKATCNDVGGFNNNYGVYGEVNLADTANIHTFAGFFNGKVNVVGQCHATVFTTSDQQFKQNIQPIGDAISVINELSPKTYYWKTNEYPQMRFTGAKQWGFVAQDIDQFLPELTDKTSVPPTLDSLGNVITAGLEYEGINYAEITPIAVRAIQQLDSTNHALQNQVNDQQNQLNDLRNQINNCCNNGSRTSTNNNGNGGNNSTVNNIDVNLSSKSIVLMQNVPNPFKEQTVISYFIPDNLTDVSIIFTDNLGNIIKNVPITEHGNGQLTVYAQDLSSGIYTYTIISNGVTIDSKRMVKTK